MLLFIAAFSACKKDKQAEPEKPAPTISNIEIGLSNNEIGVIGRDFHFNAEILAGSKIENVQVKILPRSGESYTKDWKYEITWDQYKDAKNATVHKHFNIPDNAAEGKYDFVIIVNDQNGTMLEEKRTIAIYHAENLPVDPKLALFNITVKDNIFYRNSAFLTPGSKLMKGDEFWSQVSISGIKGDGRMYLLFINKKLNHRPESIEKIDFSKAIVYQIFEHTDVATVGTVSNAIIDLTTSPFTIINPPVFAIGAASDNNVPSTLINGSRNWETGTYYFGAVYRNTTYNTSFFHYIEVPLEIN